MKKVLLAFLVVLFFDSSSQGNLGKFSEIKKLSFIFYRHRLYSLLFGKTFITANMNKNEHEQKLRFYLISSKARKSGDVA